MARLNSGQATLTSTAAQIAAAENDRSSIAVTNTGSVTAFIGTTGVTATTGDQLVAGQTVEISVGAAVYGVTSSSSTTVSYLEEVRDS